LTSLSQEHGKVQARDAARIEGLYRVGDKVRILEHHSCLAVALFDEMTVVRGQEVVDHWRVMRER
jgi:D-serine deaminase-like pyridoxal phosphate-dependent protein